MPLSESAKQWSVPLSAAHTRLGEAHRSMQAVTEGSDTIPFIVQLIENPKYQPAGFEIFSGATDLQTHDYIHIVLGRGILPKDEAFVLGFTMGATKRVSSLEEKAYGLLAKYVYPGDYRFNHEDYEIYRNALRLGFISNCQPLHRIDFAGIEDMAIGEVRKELGVEANLLRAYFEIEKKRYPGSPESQRLLN